MLKLKRGRNFNKVAYEGYFAKGGSAQRQKNKDSFAKTLNQSFEAWLQGDKKDLSTLPLDPYSFDFSYAAELMFGAESYRRMRDAYQNGLRPAAAMQAFEATQFDEQYSQLAGNVILAMTAAEVEEQSSVASSIVMTEESEFLEDIKAGFTTTDSRQDISRNKGEDFVELGFGKDFVRTTQAHEFGVKVKLNLRDLMFNRVGGSSAIARRAREIGKVVADRYTDDVYKALPLGQTNYRYNDRVPGVGMAPYSTAAVPVDPIYWQPNQLVNNPLQNTVNIQNAQAALAAQREITNGRALNTPTRHLLTSMETSQVASEIVGQREVRTINGNQERVVTGNGLMTTPQIFADSQIALLAVDIGFASSPANASALWWTGDFLEAWGYHLIYDMETVALDGRNTQAFLESGTILQVRVSKMGSPYWRKHGVQRVVRCIAGATP